MSIVLAADGSTDVYRDIDGDIHEAFVGPITDGSEEDSDTSTVAKFLGSGLLAYLSVAAKSNSNRTNYSHSHVLKLSPELREESAAIAEAFDKLSPAVLELMDLLLHEIDEESEFCDLNFRDEHGFIIWSVKLNNSSIPKSKLPELWNLMNDLLSEKVEHTATLCDNFTVKHGECVLKLRVALCEEIEGGAKLIRDRVGYSVIKRNSENT